MTFSLSADLFRNLEASVISDILNPFANCHRPDIRVAIDDNEIILRRYEKNVKKEYVDGYNYWLFLMTSNILPRFKKVPIDLHEVNEEEYCLKVASAIKGSRGLITSSFDSFKYELNGEDEVSYEGVLIKVYEIETAKQLVNKIGGDNNFYFENSSDIKVNIDSYNNECHG